MSSPYNHSFSDLSDESAYWLGFIWADGHIGIYDGSYRFSVTLKREDKSHLENLAEFLGYSKDRVSVKEDCVIFQVNSKQLYQDLRDWGIVENKSTSIENIYCEVEYMNHFVRGLFDGDGHIGIHHRNDRGYDQPVFTFTGQEVVVGLVKEFIEIEINTSIGDILRKGSYYSVSTASKEKICEIYNILYPAGPCLERKKQTFQDATDIEMSKANRKYERYSDDGDGRGKVKIVCDYCGDEEWQRADHAKRNDSCYCSVSCANKDK